MERFKKIFKRNYIEYVTNKINNKNKLYFPFMYINEACNAVQSLMPKYDLGIEIAIDGLYLGYIFQLYGFPTKAVKVGRKGKGATWQPLDEINFKDIKNKKLLILDNDVVTGRTLNRTVRELSKFSPKYMDLLLIFEKTYLTVEDYKKWSKNYSLPNISEIFSSSEIKSVRESKEGLEIYYKVNGNTERIYLDNKSTLPVKTLKNVPKEIRKIMTLEKDFNNNSKKGIKNLEKILRGR